MRDLGIAGMGYDTTAEGLSRNTHMKDKHAVQRGDIVFLTNGSGHITHVEIALGPVGSDGKIPILHASSSHHQVIEAHQQVAGNVLVGTPGFYKS